MTTTIVYVTDGTGKLFKGIGVTRNEVDSQGDLFRVSLEWYLRNDTDLGFEIGEWAGFQGVGIPPGHLQTRFPENVFKKQ